MVPCDAHQSRSDSKTWKSNVNYVMVSRATSSNGNRPVAGRHAGIREYGPGNDPKSLERLSGLQAEKSQRKGGTDTHHIAASKRDFRPPWLANVSAVGNVARRRAVGLIRKNSTLGALAKFESRTTPEGSGAVLSACTATLNVVVQDPCTARRRNHKPHLPIRPENLKTSIEVAVRRVFDLRVQGASFRVISLSVVWKFISGTLKAFFWTLTACEVSLIWSVNHLRSPTAHRILGIIVHPWANFPPKPRISLLFAIGWSISLLSLTIHLIFRSRYRRVRQSYTSLEQSHHVSRKRIKVTRRIMHGSNPFMAIGSASCNIVPGSFAYECWVWRMRFGGTLFCLLGVFYLVFWLVMVIRRCVRSQRGGGTVLEPVEGTSSPDTMSPEEDTELLVMERLG